MIIFGVREHSSIVPSNVFEIGSRDAHDAHILANAFNLTDKDCFVFEANPYAAEQIMKDYPNMHLFNNAVTDTPGTLDFHLELDNIGASSLYNRTTPTEGMRTVQVEAVTMEEVIDSLDIKTIDVAKIDVEGATLPVLKSFGKHLNKLQSIQLEMEHGKEIWQGQTLYPEISEWLIAHNYVQIMFTLLRGIQSDSFWLAKNRMIL